MAILKVDTISGIGTEGPVFEGDIEFTSQNFLTLPKGDTTQRGRGRGLLGGSNDGSPFSNSIQFITIQSQGNSIIIIEHNLDVIKTADHIIDMGPEGGINGGRIIAEGAPEKVAEVKESFTGKFLKEIMGDNSMKKTA